MEQLCLFNTELYTNFESSEEYKSITRKYQKEVFQIVKEATINRDPGQDINVWRSVLGKRIKPLRDRVDGQLSCARSLRRTDILLDDINYLDSIYKEGV